MRRLLLTTLILAALALPAAAANVVELHVDDIIQPVMAGYVARGIDYANRSNADAVLIWVNTPGGLETSMREIVDKIIHSRVPVIVYVAPGGSRAASAGDRAPDQAAKSARS